MTNYNPNIPAGPDNISADQPLIQNNFSQINSQFGIDHTPLLNSGSNGDGHHKQVTFNVAIADPNPVSTFVAYPKTLNSAVELAWQNGNSSSNVSYITGGAGVGAAAWVNFNGRGSTGACTVNSSFNITGVSRTSSPGVYIVTFTRAFQATTYTSVIAATNSNTAPIGWTSTPSTGSIQISFGTGTFVPADPATVSIVFYGALA